MKRRGMDSEPRARDLLDEAIHLLRTAPLAAWLSYAAGVVPFLLASLYFVFDMSRNAYADDRCAPLSLGLALAFVWMRTCQAAFAGRLRARIAAADVPAWTPRQWLHVAASQGCLQATGLLVLPLALILMVPFPWAYAYYHNAAALAGSHQSLRSLHWHALQETPKWPRQNFFLIKLFFLLAFVVWCNWLLMVALVIPHLLQVLLGLEANATLEGLHGLDLSTFAVSSVLTYLVVDPIARAAYTLRVFQGEAVASGEDILAELAQLRRGTFKAPAAYALTAGLLAAACGSAGLPRTVSAQEAQAPGTAPVAAAELDQAAERVLARSEYAWRLPRQRPSNDAVVEEGWLAGFLRRTGEAVRDGLKWLGDQVIKLLEWIFGGRRGDSDTGGGIALPSAQTMGLLLLAAVAAVLIIVLFVARWKRRRSESAGTAQAIAAPDLAAEDTLASALPENEWLRLAETLLGRGELRLALRALHFAGLAFLSERGLIAVARFKSDRDYEGELLRKAHALPAATAAFSRNVRVFERVWYGTHAATPEGITAFRADLNELRGES